MTGERAQVKQVLLDKQVLQERLDKLEPRVPQVLKGQQVPLVL